MKTKNNKERFIIFFRGEYFFLSNFYPVPIRYKGIDFPSVEHSFAAAKSTSRTFQKRISQINPRQAVRAKRYSRNIRLRRNWDKIKIGIMKKLIERKFSNPEMTLKLLSTGDMNLIEGNFWHDNFWGVCFCPRCKGKPKKNNLGKIIMETRLKLRKQKGIVK